MADSNKQALLLIAITVCLVLVLQPNVMSSFVKKAEAPRRVLTEAELQLFTTTANTGEIVMSGANGVLIDQGSNAVRVGTDKVSMFASNKERVKLTSSGLQILPATNLGASGAVDASMELMTKYSRLGTPTVQNSCSFGIAVGAKDVNIASDGRVDFRVSKGASAGNIWGETPDTTVMTLLGNGYVGIGTNYPTELLHIGTNDVYNNASFGIPSKAMNAARISLLQKPRNIISYQGAVSSTDYGEGGDIYLYVQGLTHSTWGGKYYGGSAVIRAGTVLSNANNGTVTGGFEIGGDVYIDSGGVIARNDAGSGPFKRGGNIVFRTGKVQNVSNSTDVDNTPHDYTIRMLIDGYTGNVGIGTGSPDPRSTLTIYKNIYVAPQTFKVGGSRGTYYKVRIPCIDAFSPSSFTITRHVHLDDSWAGSMGLSAEFRGPTCGNGSEFLAYKYNIYQLGGGTNKFVARCTIDQSMDGGCTGSTCWVYLNGNFSYYFTGNNCYIDYYSPNGAEAGELNPTMTTLDWTFNGCGYNGKLSYDSRQADKITLNQNTLFDGNGKIGIGTTDPKGTLNIHKSLGTNDYNTIGQHNGQIRITNGIGGIGGSASRALEFALLDNGTGVIQSNEWGVGYNKLVLNPVSGNVGIGLTNPGATLHVNGTAQVDTWISTPGVTASQVWFSGTSNCYIYNGNVDTYNPTGENNLMIYSWYGIGFKSYDGGVRIAMNTRDGGAYFGGRVGFGTTNPYARLDARSAGDGVSSANWISACFGVADNNKPKIVMGTYLDTAVIGAHNGALTAWSDLCLQQGGGKVGIGMTNPTYTLDINGSIRANGGFYQPAFFYGKFNQMGGNTFYFTAITTRGTFTNSSGTITPGLAGYYKVEVNGSYGGINNYKILSLYASPPVTTIADCMTSANNSAGNPFSLNGILYFNGSTTSIYVVSTDSNAPSANSTIVLTYISP